jgi:hypothetical protein
LLAKIAVVLKPYLDKLMERQEEAAVAAPMPRRLCLTKAQSYRSNRTAAAMPARARTIATLSETSAMPATSFIVSSPLFDRVHGPIAHVGSSP